MTERRGIFAISRPAQPVSFSYQNALTGAEATFNVPPLDGTALISTPQDTGVADQAALTVMPTNETLCNHQPDPLPPPTSFDFRDEFAEYTAPITNQGNCGACWAIASTRAFASRYAFATNQKVNPLSAAYLLYCTHATTFSTRVPLEYGCMGGTLVNAYWFFVLNGVVSSDCIKYDPLFSWDVSNPDLQLRQYEVAKDVKTNVSCPMLVCPQDPKVTTPAGQPWLYKSALSYIVAGTSKQSGGSEANIRRDIYKKGPLSTGFEVRQDFLNYWKGLLEGTLSGSELVYQPKPAHPEKNPVIGNHAVQLVGWGQLGKLDYWIVANSWGATTDALDMYGHNGYFLMVRGTNAAAVESNVVAAIPAVHPLTVNAVGQPAYKAEVEMCDLIAYEINRELFVKLGFIIPRDLPDTRTMYEFTLPPLLSENAATIRAKTTCPADQPFRCPFTQNCVQTPTECGTAIPSYGSVKPVKMLTASNEKAVSREVSVKYLAEAKAQKKGRRMDVATQKSWSTCTPQQTTWLGLIVSTSLISLLLVLLLVLVNRQSK